jgi:hypothetical protein
MTDRPKHAIINCETGETTMVDFTDEEIAENLRIHAESVAQRAEDEAKQEAIAQAKVSAIEKLSALGLTEDEAKAIAG